VDYTINTCKLQRDNKDRWTGYYSLFMHFLWKCPDCGTNNQCPGGFTVNRPYPAANRDQLAESDRTYLDTFVERFFDPTLVINVVSVPGMETTFSKKKESEITGYSSKRIQAKNHSSLSDPSYETSQSGSNIRSHPVKEEGSALRESSVPSSNNNTAFVEVPSPAPTLSADLSSGKPESPAPHPMENDLSAYETVQDTKVQEEHMSIATNKMSSLRVPSASPATLLRRASLFLEDEEWDKAFLYFDVVLDHEPENALAYLGELLSDLHLHSKEELKDFPEPYMDNKFYKNTLRFADEALSEELKAFEIQAKEARDSLSHGTPETMLQRAFLFLEDEEWDKAFLYCESVLDQEPYNGLAYLGELLSDLHLHSKEELRDYSGSFSENKYWKKVLRFADESLSCELKDFLQTPERKKEASITGTPESLTRRAFLFLNDEEWDKASEYCNKALDQDPEYAYAYLGKLLADYRLHRIQELSNCGESFSDNQNYRLALQYGDNALLSLLPQNQSVKESSQEKPKEPEYTPIRYSDGSWRCICGRMNDDYVSTCVCGRNKRDVITGLPVVSAEGSEEDYWICPVCKTRNARQVLACGCGYRHF
ncbi:MAG: tetratricopeptide repeat protein, partial [Lachnospiraceae bacterium]|nr:tetratricopeptide repeat protein [Lachnospiraceae bacterium]